MDVHRHLAYLHDSTLRINAGLDVDQAGHTLCDVLVPHMADIAAVYLRQIAPEASRFHEPADAPMLRLSVNGKQDDEGWAPPLPRQIHLRDLSIAFGEAMRTGRSVVRSLSGICPNHPYLKGKSGHMLVVPVRFLDRVQGFAVLLRRPESGQFSDHDILTATLIVDQTALTMHNAFLFRREADIAGALQRNMLPKSPPVVQGMEIAHRYLPSNPAAQVGGDWFDAIALPGNRMALVIGDVMGHGIPSAAAMGQLRTAARTLASLDPLPDQALRQLDELAGQLSPDHLATCLYCVYDPVTRRCSIANAGHIPPILVHPDGRTEIIELPSGAPIGLGLLDYETVEIAAPDGGLLVLCTDGLVESRSRDLDAGLAALCATLAPHDRPLDTLCADVVQAVDLRDREDDIALLVARFNGIPSGDVARWILRPHPLAASRARRLIRVTLERWGLSDLSDVTELLVTELVSNAIRFASRPIELRLLRTDTLLCEVTDDDHRLPQLREPREDDEGGRGLWLIRSLARQWGASRTTSGKAVWFDLALPGTSPGRTAD